VIGISIWLARGGRYRVHKRIQIVSAVVLLATIVAFEIDIRFLTDWRQLAHPSPFYDSGVVDWALGIHLAFAIPTPVVWAITIALALRQMPDPPAPCLKAKSHRRWGWASAVLLVLTAVTGCAFYWIAFAT
jgi:hypothetical protein